MDFDQTLKQDEKLKKLALQAQNHPPRSLKRRQALTQLTQEILNSGRLCRPNSSQFVNHYSEIYEIAVQNLMLYICTNIEQYKPELAPVMRWVNFLLKKRFFTEAIPQVLAQQKSNQENESQPTLSELIQQVIEEDVDGVFRSRQIKGHPQANFREIFRRRIIEQESWGKISTDFDIKVSTLSDFYQRSIKYFSEEIKQRIQN